MKRNNIHFRVQIIIDILLLLIVVSNVHIFIEFSKQSNLSYDQIFLVEWGVENFIILIVMIASAVMVSLISIFIKVKIINMIHIILIFVAFISSYFYLGNIGYIFDEYGGFNVFGFAPNGWSIFLLISLELFLELKSFYKRNYKKNN